MRTKSLCLAVAALAGGLGVASAQSNVYSLNIVGYVNTVLKGGSSFTLVANPLDAPTNDLNSIMSSALPNKSQVVVYSGGNYLTAQKGSTGFAPNFSVPPGTGFFVKNVSATAVTNTFVGNVVPGVPGTNTVSIPLGFSLVGSTIPIGGTLNDSGPNTLNLVGVVANKSQVITYDNSGGGAYITSQKGSTGFAPNVPISVGQGFFIKAASAGSNWVQILQ